MQYFKFPSYKRETVTLLRAYAENTAAFLRRLHPEVSNAQIQDFVTNEINRHLNR